ncbi:MAG: glutaminyl-peptide cyclotransferase [Cyclobacteriaceae bacterium]|nr:glutaminyl-peptide cyclotransferase [Cyclobacteriaceae bacterium]
MNTLRNRLFFLFFIFLASCTPKKKTEVPQENLIPYTVVQVFPHDTKAFTQGLTVYQGRLFESTGQDNSWIAEVDIATGIQSKKVTLDKQYFGEGITIINNKIYQLTWQNHVGFVYDFKTFGKIADFKNEHEGWGITHNGSNLIMSDGTSKLYFLDTANLTIVKSVSVKENEIEQGDLNELEFIDGHVYANQWKTNYLLKIDPATGNVVGRMDLTPLYEKALAVNPNIDVLNGIAYESKSKLLLVTGKNWPALFAIRLK